MAEPITGCESPGFHGDEGWEEAGNTMATTDTARTSDTFTSDEFTDLIAQTEMSMRNKLSELTLPDQNLSSEEAECQGTGSSIVTNACTGNKTNTVDSTEHLIGSSGVLEGGTDVVEKLNNDEVKVSEESKLKNGGTNTDTDETLKKSRSETGGGNSGKSESPEELKYERADNGNNSDKVETREESMLETADGKTTRPVGVYEHVEENSSQVSKIGKPTFDLTQADPDSSDKPTCDVSQADPEEPLSQDKLVTDSKDCVPPDQKVAAECKENEKDTGLVTFSKNGTIVEVPFVGECVETEYVVEGNTPVVGISSTDANKIIVNDDLKEISKEVAMQIDENTEDIVEQDFQNNRSKTEMEKSFENSQNKNETAENEGSIAEVVNVSSDGEAIAPDIKEDDAMSGAPETATNPDMFSEAFMITDVRSLSQEEVLKDNPDDSLIPNKDNGDAPAAAAKQQEQTEGGKSSLDSVTANQENHQINVPRSNVNDSSNPECEEQTSSLSQTSEQIGNIYQSPEPDLDIISPIVSTNQMTETSQVTTNSQSSIKNYRSGSLTCDSSLPIISDIFSIKDEPLSDSGYGVMTSDVALHKNTTTISKVVNRLQGQKVIPDPDKAAKSLKLRIAKVSTINQPLKTLVTPRTNSTGIPQLGNIRKVSHPSLTQVSTGSTLNKVGNSRQVPAVSHISHQGLTAGHITSKPGLQTTSVLQTVKTSFGTTILKPATIVKVNQLATQTRILPKTVCAAKQLQTATAPNTHILMRGRTKVNQETINIQTVGIPKLTELIARKNPIPTYKPPPVPENIRTPENTKTHPCFECGDSFYIESSLTQHINRRSMKMSYKCEHCNNSLILFTNKCQLLGHLRSHLNIEKTQAVPIHIKSDSIEITTNYDDIVPGKTFDWYTPEKDIFVNVHVSKDELKVSSVVAGNGAGKFVHIEKKNCTNAKSCSECGDAFFSNEERKNHFQSIGQRRYFCDICPVFMPTACSLSSHRRIHDIKSKVVCPEILTCPECGEQFSKAKLFQYISHIRVSCFHTSRLTTFNCTKCKAQLNSIQGLQNHLNTRLEHYYKCEKCPMALKSLKNFEKHFSAKHSNVKSTYKKCVKIIYRCHVCDTLIDDRSFLVSHVENHVLDLRHNGTFRYHCLLCTAIQDKQSELQSHHIEMHSNITHQPSFCTVCVNGYFDRIGYIKHCLMFHTRLLPNFTAKFCKHCGLCCTNENMKIKHDCLVNDTKQLEDSDTEVQIEKNDQNMKKTGSPDKISGDQSEKNDHQLANFSIIESDLVDVINDIPDHVSKTCRSCNCYFVSQSSRLNHLKLHRSEQIYICMHCDRMNFRSFHDLRSHEIMCSEVMKKKKMDEQGNAELKSKSKEKFFNGAVDSYEEISPKEDTEDNDFGRVRLTPKVIKKNKIPDVEVIYECDQCDLVFKRQSKKEEHQKMEHGWHPCHLCGQIYMSNSQLKRHLVLSHEGKKFVYYCWVCRGKKIEKFFSEKSFLERHLGKQHRMRHWDESKIVPELPGLDAKGSSPEPQKRKTSESKEVLSDEVPVKKLRVEGEKSFKCAKCLFTSEVKDEFLQHILEHKMDDAVQCLECGLCFAVFPSLKKHLFMVHKVRNFTVYLKDNNIEEEKHVEDDDGIEREPFRSGPVQESSSEEEEGNPLECKVCYKSFENQHNLKRHSRVHGMAFIKKTRRKRVDSSNKKVVNNDKAENAGVKREKLVLKIKRAKLEKSQNEENDCKGREIEANVIIERVHDSAIFTKGDQHSSDIEEENKNDTSNCIEELETNVSDGQLANSDGQLVETDGHLAGTDGQPADTDGQLAVTDGQLAGIDDQLMDTDGQLMDFDDQLMDTDGQLKETDDQLADTDGQMEETDGQLGSTNGQLAETVGQLADTDGQMEETVGQLMGTDGQLKETDDQLADTDGQMEETDGHLGVTDGQLAETDCQMADTDGQMLKSSANGDVTLK